jgi:quercetin dioxygenase-like cupin family protein
VSVRLLIFDRGQRTSYHYHLLRGETFFVLDNRIRLRIWNRYIEMRKHDSIRIPSGVPHMMITLDQPCHVLEIADGYYDQGKDIIRLADIYGRRKDKNEPDNGFI